MKKILLLLITISLTASCNLKQKRQIEEFDCNTLTDAEIRNQEIQDSLQHARLDSLALIAWGDAKFGINIKEALATNAFKDGYKYSDGEFIRMNADREIKLGKVFELKNLAEILAHFQESELKRVSIESYSVRARHINELITDCNIFIKNFTRKYGSPSFHKNKINILDFTAGKVFDYAKFRIGDKNIIIKLGEHYDGGKYYYIIYIDNNKFPQEKHIPTDKEKKEEEKRIKEVKDLEENAF